MAADVNHACRPGRTLVMGIGNLLLGDDGVGVHAIRELAKVSLPDGVRLLDAGTAFIDASAHMAGIDRLIVIDAIQGGKKPGTVYRIQVKRDSYSNYSASLHGLSVMDMLKLSQCALPESTTILGIEPEVIDWKMAVSETVSKSMPLLIEWVRDELGDLEPRQSINR